MSKTTDYIESMLSDAIRQEHADYCFDNVIEFIHRKDFEYARLECKKVLNFSTLFEQLIAAQCIIHAIETYNLELLDTIHQTVFDSSLYPPKRSK